MVYTLPQFIAEQNRWPEYFSVVDLVWMQVFAPDKPIWLDSYDFIGSFARIEILRMKDIIQRVLSTIFLVSEGDSIELPLDATCMNCAHKGAGYEVDCSLLHIGLGEIGVIGKGTIKTHSNIHSVCPLHQFAPYSDGVWLSETGLMKDSVPIDRFDKHIGGIILDNARMADSEWDSNVLTHMWIDWSIRIRLQYDFPKKCKGVVFATVTDFNKIIRSIADTVLYDVPGKGVIIWKDLAVDPEGKTSFLQSLLKDKQLLK